MASFSSSSSSKSNYHVRSVSLPSRSHPTTICVEEQLNKLIQTWESQPNADKICSGLSKLEELYRSVDELLALPLTQQALSRYQNEKWIEELLDGSIRLLDVCAKMRDAMSQIQEKVRDLQSTIRRRSAETDIMAMNTSLAKKTRKDAKKLIAELKQIDSKVAASIPALDLDHHLMSVIRVLREVGSFTASIFQSILMFLAMQVPKTKQSKWSMVSKLIQKGSSETINDSNDELENRSEALDASISEIDLGLESVFRRLIAKRASLLNMVSY